MDEDSSSSSSSSSSRSSKIKIKTKKKNLRREANVESKISEQNKKIKSREELYSKIAEMNKKLGNDQYKAQNYHSALKIYSEIIRLRPENATYYGNRSACFMMLNDYHAALTDARRSVALDDKFEKGYARVAKCCLALGNYIEAEQTVKKLNDINEYNTSVKVIEVNCTQLRNFEDKIQQSYEKKNYHTVLFLIDSAACLTRLGRFDEASDIAFPALKNDSTSVDAIYVRGLILYYQDNFDKAIIQFECALKLDPDHQLTQRMCSKLKEFRDKIEAAKNAFNAGKLGKAFQLYSEALEIDPSNKNVNSKLLYNRAEVNYKINKLRESVIDCTKVLEIDSQHLQALLLRAKCYNELEEYEECVKDYEAALKIRETQEIKNLLRDAKFALKRSKQKNYYKILGVSKNATDYEIKKAYRKKALIHHPDRHSNSSDSVKKDQEIKFKEVGEACCIIRSK